MITIIHKIRLNDVAYAERFERWVQETDYAAASDLLSIRSFSVHRANLDPSAEYHYFEVIGLTSHEAFDADMKTPLFGSLVQAFSEMAEVVGEIEGEMIDPGYHFARPDDI